MFTRIRTALARIIRNRYRSHLAGCCGCGSDAVRYVYAGPLKGRIVPDDARCSECGPYVFTDWTVDYGQDRFVTVGQVDDDVAAAVAS